MGIAHRLGRKVSPLPSFKALREQKGITLEQLSNASFIDEKCIRAFEETNTAFLDVLDALLLALSKLVGKRYTWQDIFFVPALRNWSSEPPFEGPLPENPTLREMIYHYRLDAYLIHLATDVPFRDVEEMLIGRPVKRELVERVLQAISLYLNESHTAENVSVALEE